LDAVFDPVKFTFFLAPGASDLFGKVNVIGGTKYPCGYLLFGFADCISICHHLKVMVSIFGG
jgi:hypothetical protein